MKNLGIDQTRHNKISSIFFSLWSVLSPTIMITNLKKTPQHSTVITPTTGLNILILILLPIIPLKNPALSPHLRSPSTHYKNFFIQALENQKIVATFAVLKIRIKL